MKKYIGHTAANIVSHLDHTLLSRTATVGDIEKLCEEAVRYGAASVCVPPCFVPVARAFDGSLTVCTVVGFPNGYCDGRVKCFETRLAAEAGADEIDMVINTNMLKSGDIGAVSAEIEAVRRECEGRVLKVIVETCLLSFEEKLAAAHLVSGSRADFIKTSTGFSASGATADDVALLVKECRGKQVKAAGGICTPDDAALFLALGAGRLGSSSLLGMLKADIES